MNHALCAFLACLVFTIPAGAHTWAPPTLDYVASADSVYLIKAVSSSPGSDSVHPAKIKFTVTEVLRGRAQKEFSLTAFEVNIYKKGSEWIIFHNPSGFKNCVGWAMEGDCEWLPIQVTHDNNEATAEWIGPLDGVREYLRLHPKKS